MSALQRRMLAAAALLSVSLAACSDSTSPNTVDAADLENSFTSATSTFQNNAAFQSVRILSLSFPQFAAVGIAMPSLSRLLSRNARIAHPPLSRPLPASSGTLNPQALFPSNVLGKTLQWDTASAQYVVGPLTGAPATGVRLLLYVADENTGRPTPGLIVLGYLDLTDLSTPQLNEIGVLLRLASTTIAQYTITAIKGTNSASIEAVGFMKDGTATNQVGFDLRDALATDSTFTFANDFTGSDGAAIHVVITVPPTGSIDALARLTKGRNSLELDASGDFNDPFGPLAGTVKFNGVAVGNVGGTSLAPTITGANGHTLTTAQSDALLGIFEAALTDVLEVSDGLFGPGIIVFNH